MYGLLEQLLELSRIGRIANPSEAISLAELAEEARPSTFRVATASATCCRGRPTTRSSGPIATIGAGSGSRRGAFRAWTGDLALTARFDILRNWLLKLEFHRFDGTAVLSPAENPGGVEPSWNLFVVKTTFHF